jgi:hypothetical protein
VQALTSLGAPSLSAGVSERLASSELIRYGGAALARLADAETIAAMRLEALARGESAETARVLQPRDEDTRRGDPDRWLDWAPGGPALKAFYLSPHVLATLGQITGVTWMPSGRQGSYSYYRRPGQYLGLHRDVDVCDLAIITCVDERLPATAGSSGMLCLYPGRTRDRLSEIRRSPNRGPVVMRLEPGTSLILLGGMIPHWLMPVAAGQARIVAPLCYRPAA